MPYIGNIVQDFSVSTAMLNSDSVTSIKVLDGTIVNVDINDSAAIAGTKISPDFGSQNIVTTGTLGSNHITVTSNIPKISLVDTDNNSDFDIRNANGVFSVVDTTNDSARFFIDSNGTVDVVGNLDVGSGLDVTGGGLTVDTGTTNTCATFTSSDAGANINVIDNSARSTFEQNGADLKIVSDTGNEAANSTIKLQVDASTKMTILSSGNVGIGTTSPNAKLEVAGSQVRIRSTDNSSDAILDFYGQNTSNGAIIRSFGSDGSAGHFHFRNASNSAMTIDSSGNVGIGTTAPKRHLHIHEGAASTTVGLMLTNDATGTSNDSQGFQFKVGGDGTANIDQREDKDLDFFTNATFRMTITNGGDVGIAKSNPQAKLDVNGSAIFRSTLTLFDDTLAADSNSGTENRIKIGSNADLQLFHDARTDKNNSVIRSKQGALQINSGNSAGNVEINLNENVANETKELSAKFIKNGGVELYHNGLGPKLQTLSTGVSLDGNVGIGTTSPAQKLDVNGTGIIRGNTQVLGTVTTTIDGNQATQGGAGLVMTHATNTNLRANHFIVDDFPSGNGTYFIQATESGVSNERHICMQGYGGKVKIGNQGTAPEEKLDVEGNIKIRGGDLKISNGRGIDFSDVAGSASGSSSALLDDYEEGTFTPTNTIGLTLTNNTTAHYTKVGRVVFIQIDCTFSGSADSSICGVIQSLPFTSKSGCVNEGALQFYSNTSDAKLDESDDNTRIFIGASESRIDIQNITSGNFQTRAFLVGRRFRIQMNYLTA